MAAFDVLSATATDLQSSLESGQLSSVDIVQTYLDQIERHNRKGLKLNAIIVTAPPQGLLERARQLDDERAQGRSRGPLHGIPVIVKDAYMTGTLDMDTTAGSFALKGAKAARNAAVVDLLLHAGMIVVAKANLSVGSPSQYHDDKTDPATKEFGNMKEQSMTAGWSAVGGQTQSPYVRGGVTKDTLFLGHSTPAGSSSGSGAAVAAGFSPIALGTESDGSIISPSGRASLYGMKGTLGSIDTRAVQGVSPAFDCLGGMAKSARDLANLFTVLTEGRDFTSSLMAKWQGVKVGVVDPVKWQVADFAVEPREDFNKQYLDALRIAVKKIGDLGAEIKENLPLVTFGELQDKAGRGIDELTIHDLGGCLATFFSMFVDAPVKTVQELIEWNKSHADIELPDGHPGQQILEAAATSVLTDDEYAKALHSYRDTAVSSIDKAFDDNDIDVVIGPEDARFSTVSMAAGYPVASVPLGYADFNGRAFSMEVMAKAGQEHKILRFMCAWEATFPRKPPPMLVCWDGKD